MFTADMKPLLRQCDVGEINCYVCVGREVCDKYPTPKNERGKRRYVVDIEDSMESEPCWEFDNTFDTSVD